MSIALVRELNGEHRTLLKTLGRVAEIGTLNPETRELLGKTKAALIAHLDKEERDFYPALKKLAATTPGIEPKLAQMNREMESLASAAMRFLDTYSLGGNPERFAADFLDFRRALSERVQREEFTLYAYFLKKA